MSNKKQLEDIEREAILGFKTPPQIVCALARRLRFVIERLEALTCEGQSRADVEAYFSNMNASDLHKQLVADTQTARDILAVAKEPL